MKKLALIIALACILFSCSKDDDNATPASTAILQSITYGNGAIMEDYQNGKCVSDIFGTYTYDSPNGLLSKSTNTDGTYYQTYTYNSDNTISSIDYHQPNTAVYRHIYTYTSSLINVKVYSLPDLSSIQYQENYTLQDGLIVDANGSAYGYDSKGNVLSVLYPGLVMTNTFDDKPSVVALKLKGMFGDKYKISAILTTQFDGEQLENNFLTHSTVFSSSSYDYSYTYVYGSNGYPTQRTDNNGSILYYNYN